MKTNVKYMVALMAISTMMACSKDNVLYQGEPEVTVEEEKDAYNDFDFSTTQSDVTLNVDYKLDLPASVFFEVYDHNPATLEDYVGYKKTTTDLPLFSGFTKPGGTFTQKIDLPAYVNKVYVYSSAFFAQSLIEANVYGNTINAEADDYEEATSARRKIVTQTSTNYYCYMDENVKNVKVQNYGRNSKTLSDSHTSYQFNWHKWLGDYDTKNNGAIAYDYKGELRPSDGDIAMLRTAHGKVIDINSTCEEKYRSYYDLKLSKDAEVAVSFVGQNTCWNSSIGYYYYKEGNEPKELKNVILVFPNTQDGNYTAYKSQSKPCAGISPGTTALLRYYPNIENGDSSQSTTIFPKGTRIGFVLATNAWGNRMQNIDWTCTVDKAYRSATSANLSVNNDGKSFDINGSSASSETEPRRTAVYRYGNYVMISFEDHDNDLNYSDVIITTRSNPVDAIEGVTVVKPITKSANLKGIYAFEDLWPSKGDYDMNDVLTKYTYTKLIQDQKVISESFIFKTFENYAQLSNGLAIKLDKAIAEDDTVKCYILKANSTDTIQTNFTYEKEDNVFLLTDNVKRYPEGEYILTIAHGTPVDQDAVNDAHPFIWRAGSDNGRWEMHIAQEAPTNKVDTSLFGTEDDQSDTSKGIYYVRKGNYPFGFFLSGADEIDLKLLLEPENEKTPISELYPNYINWVNSNGTTNTTWYKNE